MFLSIGKRWRMMRWMNAAAIVAGMVLGWMMVAAGPAGAATPQQVNAAIDRAREYLHKQQQNGNWEAVPAAPLDAMKDVTEVTGAQYAGLTGIATYALLAGGDSPKDAAIQQAVKFLSEAPTAGIYAIAMRAQVWGYLPQTPEIKECIRRDGRLLLQGMRAAGEARGLYHYTKGDGDDYDHSVSQYGILGMWALQQAFFEVPYDFWKEADAAWRRHQLPDGGWCYINGGQGGWSLSTPSMTAAGIATLFITSDYIHGREAVECHGNLADKHIDAGLKWMADNFNRVWQSGEVTWYTLYGLERIGVASGRKYFGSNNWYAVGADWLVQHQNADGSWGGGDAEIFGKNFHNVPDTAFGILFLVRGRAPVMMQKLQYDVTDGKKSAEGPWNQRPRDLAHLTRWSGRSIERDLNWQSTSLAAPIDELHDAPILYISGNRALSFTDEEKSKLVQYVQEGGLILGNADCGSEPFSRSFQKLGEEIFAPYKFRELPANHPIYVNEQFSPKKWEVKPVLQALSNGVRELMILVPRADFSRRWQLVNYAGHEESFQAANNIYLYAIDKQTRFKGETHIVRPDPQASPERSIKAARLSYDGNWNPEPAGWTRLAAVMRNKNRVDLSVETVKIGDGKLDGFKAAHLTGTAAWKLPKAGAAELHAFLDKGGTLIIDAAGGSAAFAESTLDNLEGIYPDVRKKLENPLPAGDAVFSATGRAAAIDYRVWARKNLLGSMREARIRGMEIAGRGHVYFSAEDLSGGLVGQEMDGIIGYTPEAATELMAGMLMHASK